MKTYKVPLSFGLIIFLALMACQTKKEQKYYGIAVENGGTISGFVKFEGTLPERKPVEATKDKEVCGKHTILPEDLIVADNGGIQNVVVYIKDITHGKPLIPPTPNPILDQNGCTFRPHVLIVPAGAQVDVLNSDGVLHNLHTHSIVNQVINEAMPGSVTKMTKFFEMAEEPFKMSCDIHPWMSGWIVIAKHPYYTKTDETGNFQLTEVPAGKYTLEFWHEKLGKMTREVTVEADQETKLEVVMTEAKAP